MTRATLRYVRGDRKVHITAPQAVWRPQKLSATQGTLSGPRERDKREQLVCIYGIGEDSRRHPGPEAIAQLWTAE